MTSESRQDVDVILEANAIAKSFAGLKAVGGTGGLSFVVPRGSLVGLIGPNGAGKSTTFNLLSGNLQPDQGRVAFNGQDITALDSSAIAELGVGRTFQTPKAFESLTVVENVAVGVTSPGETLAGAFGRAWKAHEARARKAALEVLERIGLADVADRPVGDLSGGELRMLEVGRQMVRNPEILLLDEPTAGVHPRLQKRLAELLTELRSDGVTLVVVEHNLHFLLALADHVVVLTHGDLLAEGTADEVRDDPSVIAAYIGDDNGT